jgi:3-deoxy-D-manno-octulosonic-acid transferase
VILGLYAGAASLAAPALRLMLRRRLRAGREIAARLPERWGADPAPRPPGRLLWLHGASVGEALSILPVLPLLTAQAPDLSLLLTTGTVTSAALTDRRLIELGLAERARHRFVPLDVPAWIARFLDHWRPDAAGFIEQEVWPNTLSACARRGIPLVLLNARLSARSAARWQRLGSAARTVFGRFERVLAQSAADAERFAALGARRVSTPGNLKFAAAPLPVDTAELDRLRGLLAGRPVWLAASTHPGEEPPVLDAHARLAASRPGLLTMVVPRHPARGAGIAALCAAWPTTRRAAGQDPPTQSGVWIADTMGELGLFYRLAPLAFIGGSLVAHGGQNPLEAARLGCALAAGPHMANFLDMERLLRAAGALAPVTDAASLAAWAGALLDDPPRRAAIGQAARQAAAADDALPALVAATLLGLLPAGPG